MKSPSNVSRLAEFLTDTPQNTSLKTNHHIPKDSSCLPFAAVGKPPVMPGFRFDGVGIRSRANVRVSSPTCRHQRPVVLVKAMRRPFVQGHSVVSCCLIVAQVTLKNTLILKLGHDTFKQDGSRYKRFFRK